MSYILDALRKADADRERDPARGIHAQPVAPATPSGGSPARTRFWVAGAGLALLVAVGLGWQFAPQRGDGAPGQGVATSAPAAPAQAVPAAALPVPAAPAVAPAEPPAPATAVLPPPPPVIQVAAPAAPALKQAPATPSSLTAASAPAAAPAQVAPPAERVFAVSELPADVQQALPKLAITGGVYSENAAQRMLIVGGQVVGEGTEIASGLVLEQIRAKTAVLRFRGWRYAVGY